MKLAGRAARQGHQAHDAVVVLGQAEELVDQPRARLLGGEAAERDEELDGHRLHEGLVRIHPRDEIEDLVGLGDAAARAERAQQLCRCLLAVRAQDRDRFGLVDLVVEERRQRLR